MKIGGSLKVSDIKKFIEDSKNESPIAFDNWVLDYDLSTHYVKVYTNKNSNQVVIMHRGTNDFYDVLTDVGLAVNHKKGYRFDSSKQIQQLAEEKYGPENISVLGYSLGGLLAEMYAGPDVKEIITFNKALVPYDLNRDLPPNQYDIRTKNNLVSILKNVKKHKNDVIISSESYSPLTEHKADTLDRIPGNTLVGNGIETYKKYNIKDLKLLVKKNANEKDLKVNITGLKKMELISILIYLDTI